MTPIESGAMFNKAGAKSRATGFICKQVDCFLRFPEFNSVLAEAMSEKLTQENSFALASRLLQLLNISYSSKSNMAHSVEGEPRIYYANHPFGIADALIMLDLVSSFRRDVKILSNEALKQLDIPDHIVLWVSQKNRALNSAALRAAVNHLKLGGALLIFPAGVCSRIQLRSLQVQDPTWSLHLARILGLLDVKVVPILFNGSNSILFQLISVFGRTARTALLVREFLRLRDKKIKITCGNAIQISRTEINNPSQLTRSLRSHLESLISK